MLAKISSLLACCIALALGGLAPLPARSQTAETATPSLLQPGALAYAASGSYGLSYSGDTAAGSFDLFAPVSVGQRSARFAQVRLGFTGTSAERDGRLSLGGIWRMLPDPEHVFGLNAYVDLGGRTSSGRIMGQASLGMEYESARASRLGQSRLTFGSNLYIPFADYTARAMGIEGSLPRRGLDGYIAWSRQLTRGFGLGSQLSLFHYPATRTRPSRGIATFTVNGSITRGLPEGSSLQAGLTGRYTADQPLDPRLSLQYRWALTPASRSGGGPVGDLQPPRNCVIVPGARRVDRLDCGPASRRRAQRIRDFHVIEGPRASGAATVPPPQRSLGYGTLYVP